MPPPPNSAAVEANLSGQRGLRVRAWVCAAALAVSTVSAGSAQTPDRGDPGASHPSREELARAGWLGRFERGPETVETSWEDRGLVLRLGSIAVPADGRWHETVSTFSVRHRVTWLSGPSRLRLEEQHNHGAHWTYELALEGDELLKLIPPGARQNTEPLVQRRYRRVPFDP